MVIENRVDDQVTIRGRRVEPGAIEAVLTADPALAQAAVVVVGDTPGDQRLVAYVVPDETTAPLLMAYARMRRAGELDQAELREMPNGMLVLAPDRSIAEQRYEEVFARGKYLGGGLALPDRACVIDVGAREGMFTLFAGAVASGSEVYAFEPAPELADRLQANAKLNDVGATVIAGWPGGHAEPPDAGAGSLSQLIEARRIRAVDLLKVAAGDSALGILRGIEPRHWTLVRQVTVEARDDGGLAAVTGLLERRGFRVTAQSQPGRAGAGAFMVYAARPGAVPADRARRDPGRAGRRYPGRFFEDLRADLARRLPDDMMPSAVVVLDEFPLTPDGRLDRRALPRPRGAVGRDGPPRPGAESWLAGVFADLLGVESVGENDDFFLLGGHSLLATRLVARIRTELGVELPLARVFEHPTVAELAPGIPADARLDAVRQSGAVIPVDRSPEAAAGVYPLSFAQEHLWVLQQLSPPGPLYHVGFSADLAGSLDPDRLRSALDVVVARHAVLRGRIRAERGQLTQVMRSYAAVELPVTDVRELPAKERDQAVRALISGTASAPFDLGGGPLLRCVLLRLGEDEWRLVVVFHHVVVDDWSLWLFAAELVEFYRAGPQPGAAGVAPLPVSYGDFASWQRMLLADEVLAAGVEHWVRRLSGVPVLDLPTDRPRPAVRSYQGDMVRFELGEDLVARVRQAAAGHGATVFMAAMAAWQVVLGQFSGQADFAVGTPFGGRARPELEPLIGCFVNTLAIRADLSGDPSFATVLGRVREACVDAFAHAEVPFAEVVAALSPDRSAAAMPLAQTLFSLHQFSWPAVELPGLAAMVRPLRTGTSRVDLSLGLTEHDGAMTGELEYSTDLFDRDTITSLADRVVHTLTQLTTNGSTPLSRMALIPPGELARLRELSVGPMTQATADLEDLCRWGDRIAVESEGWAVTYAELDALRDRLAAVLRARGASRGSRVGICLERSPWLVAAILAVWQAGAAYVPMDPAYPAERLRLSAQDAGLNLVLTDARSESAAAATGAGVIRVDRDLAEAGAEPARTRTGGWDAAYVIFTSGSTGRPKGVTVPRRAIGNLLSAMRAVTGFGEQDVLLAVTTPAFDIAALELLLPLTCGGRVVIASPTVASDGTLLAQALDRHQVTFTQATPATWRLLAQTGWAGRPGLTVICGGEELPRSLARWLRTRTKRLWNVYGPTETTVWSTAGEVAAGEGPVPLGAPLANTRIHVVDGWLHPTPIGVPGELLIGGAGVADGYAGQPGLTASRFVPDPFGSAGGRLYRTGDIVRFRRGGSLEFLGRRDQQVKLRGFRIELGEIEARLRLAAGVRDAVVIVREEGDDDLRLTGYVLAEGSVDAAAVQAELRQFLPPYMVPSAVVVLDEFPLTPNGKLDRRALPAPGTPAARPRAGDHADVASELNDILAAVEALAAKGKQHD